MEEKKFDKNSIIGFALIFIIVIWIMFNFQQKEQKEKAQKAKQEQLDKIKQAKQAATKTIEKTIVDTTVSDTAKLQKLQTSLGAFAFSATLPSAKNDFKIIENDLVYLKVANKGGYIIEKKKFTNKNKQITFIKFKILKKTIKKSRLERDFFMVKRMGFYFNFFLIATS